MSDFYTKLFSSITDSTIWAAPDATRLVWITMLAMSDQHGYVGASVPGLAARARVSLDDCIAALDTFSSPDKWSRTPDFEGRRIAPTDGGWFLLNHAKYRAIQDKEARREQSKIAMQKLRANKQKLTVNNVNTSEPPLTQIEVEVALEVEALKSKPLSDKSDASPSNSIKNQQAVEVLEYLNRLTGRKYRPVKSNLSLILARLAEGYDPVRLKEIAFEKFDQWAKDDKMAEYLRPATLYNARNCAQYDGVIQ